MCIGTSVVTMGGMPVPLLADPVVARPVLARLPVYRPGRRASGPGTGALASNESHFGPLPAVLDAVLAEAAHVNRYPDAAATDLRAAIAARTGTVPEQVSVGTGSVAVLAQVLAAYCDPGDEVVYAWRSFEAYPILVDLAGATAVEVPLTVDARHDLSAMAAAVTARTKVMFVCTPNNPTGTQLTHAELAELLTHVPSHVLVVVDEAYLEFATGPSRVDTVALLDAHPNLCTLRTFSKAYGLAGLRVGYALAAPPVAEALRRVAIPFGVSAPAQAAARASLAATSELTERVDAVVRERARMLRAARDLGWELPDSQANFLWLPTPTGLHERLVGEFDAADLLVRPFAGEGVRVTVADPATNDRVLAVLRRIADAPEPAS